MRILFLAPTYQDLYKPILEELQKNHDVYYIEDNFLPTDCYLVDANTFKKIIYSLYNNVAHVYERYWEKVFENNPALNEPFDVFFCIQGVSVCPSLIDRLKHINPKLLCSLYIWDTLKYYNYERNIPLFDQAFSFDYDDAMGNSNLGFLPFYWVGMPIEECEIYYDISIIGNDHDDRFQIISKVLPELEENRLRYFIKIKPCNEYEEFTTFGKVRMSILHPSAKKRILQNFKNCAESHISLRNNMTVIEVEDVIRHSKCIIDTDRESQTGTTPRVIWALAQGKGVLTTNKSIVKMPFYNETSFRIFDRENPSIDVQFIKSFEPAPVSEYIEGLRIDKWINNFIYKKR